MEVICCDVAFLNNFESIVMQTHEWLLVDICGCCLIVKFDRKGVLDSEFIQLNSMTSIIKSTAQHLIEECSYLLNMLIHILQVWKISYHAWFPQLNISNFSHSVCKLIWIFLTFYPERYFWFFSKHMKICFNRKTKTRLY